MCYCLDLRLEGLFRIVAPGTGRLPCGEADRTLVHLGVILHRSSFGGNTKLNVSDAGSQESARRGFWRKRIRHVVGEVDVHICGMGTKSAGG